MIEIIFVLATLFVWFCSKFICVKFLKNILPPILLSGFIVILFLVSNNISANEYKEKVWMIDYLLGPATVMLAIPLYKEVVTLKRYFKQILFGISISVALSLLTTFSIAYLCNLPTSLTLSFVPHSVTTPIGIEISQLLSAEKSITVASIILSGLLGAMISVPVFKILKIKSPIAKGLAIGSTSHALGTTRAIEIGETEGAISSLAIPLTAIITSLVCAFLY